MRTTAPPPHLPAPVEPAIRAGGRQPLHALVPLRVTLVALLVALMAAALAATGFAATSLLRGYLLEQQDQQLRSSLEQLEQQASKLAQACSVTGLRIPSTLYVACMDPADGTVAVVQGPRDDDALPDVDRIAGDVDEDGTSPFTLPSTGGGASWRVAVAAVTDDFAIVVGQDLDEDQAALHRLVRIELVVGVVVLAVLGTAGYLLVRNSLRPLQEVEHTAQAIAGGDLSRRVPSGDERTEVGRLSAALNGMLGRIESSFRAQQSSEEQARASEGRMRRFVADASHELRTPLTSIRGFAELHRQGAVRGPEDTSRILSRIEAEATRMGCWWRTCCSWPAWTSSGRSPWDRSTWLSSPATPSTTRAPCSPTGR